MSHTGLKKYSLLIFDWDGTLMDASGTVITAFQHVFRSMGYPVPTTEYLRTFVGLSPFVIVSKLLPRETEQIQLDVERAFKEHYFAQTSAPLFPRVFETLQGLKGLGYQLAVATGKGRKALDALLTKTEIGHLLSTSKTSEETKDKPNPMMLEEILETLSVPSVEALMIGDTPADIEMANAAGIDAVGVTCGGQSAETLQTLNPVAVLSGVSDLTEWLVSRKCLVTD